MFFRFRTVAKILIFPIIAGTALLLGYWYVNGSSLGPRSFAADFVYYLKNAPRMLSHGSGYAQYRGKQNTILFLHHSVGAGFIRAGRLRQMLQEAGYQLWDQGYRSDQLSGPDGRPLGYSYNIPADSTDPEGFYALFSQKRYSLPVNGFSQVMQHGIIVLKSCYPVSYIESDARLAAYRRCYLGMRDVIDQHPDRLFIFLTQPPLNPAATSAEIAGRARALASWLKSDEFIGGRRNLAVFDLFDVLAEWDQSQADANMLRADYRSWADSHPNAAGSAAAAKLIAEFVIEKARSYPER